ncbi:hypothetical protein O185_00590, partial [Photorhabdus temperata J3]
MTEQSTKSLRLGVVAAVLLGFVGTGFGIYQFVKEKELAQEIANVNQVKDAEGVTFKNKAEFDAAVAASINKFVEQKQQADIDQKYAQFEGAPEKVEDGKHIYGELGARFTLVEFSDL